MTPADEDFEVRVIGGNPRPPRVEEGLEEPEAGLRIGVGSSRRASPAWEEDGPVHRLEAEPIPAGSAEHAKVRARLLNADAPAGKQVRHRRKEDAGRVTRWTVWMAISTVLLAVATVIAVMSTNRNQAGDTAIKTEAVAFTQGTEIDREREEFLLRAPAMSREAQALLLKYAAATRPEDVLPLVRRRSQIEPRLMSMWRPWGSDPPFPVGNSPEWAILDEPGRPVLALELSGRKGDFTRYRAVFVPEDGQVKLDWEATEVISDVPLPTLMAGTTPVKDALLRVVVSASDFYAPDFPDDRYRAYQLQIPEEAEFIWAYAPRDSRVAEILGADFNEDALLLEKAVEIRATLRVTGPRQPGTNLYEITEMLHKGWVSP